MAIVAKSKSEISKERILIGARELILTRGYSAMTVDAICALAGITKGGFFHHFPSKDKLGEAVLAMFWSEAKAREDSAEFKLANNPKQYLEQYLEYAIDAYQDPELQKGCMLAIYTMELQESNEQLFTAASQYFSEWRNSLYKMFEDAGQHSGKTLDVQAWVDLFISTLEGALLVAKSNKDPAVINRSLKLFKRLIMQTLS